MWQIRWKMYWAREGSYVIVPIAYSNRESPPAIAIPIRDMHMTYLAVRKHENQFDLLWVNRPDASLKQNLDTDIACARIEAMLDTRFPFVQSEKLSSYPVKASAPAFPNQDNGYEMSSQGGRSNCVVSNLFGTFGMLDRIHGDFASWRKRNITARSYLQKNYDFMRHDFTPFPDGDGPCNLSEIWEKIENRPDAEI